MKNIFKRLKDVRNGFNAGKTSDFYLVHLLITLNIMYMVYIVLTALILIAGYYVSEYFSILSIPLLIGYSIITFTDNPIRRKILRKTLFIPIYLSRYGNVISLKDWRFIKRANPQTYARFWSPLSLGKCYYFSRWLAAYIDDAKLMYCSITLDDGTQTAHSVIVKDDCVFDPNARMHYNYDEYLRNFGAQVFRFYTSDMYLRDSFFDNIREDLLKWCADNNVSCEPQVHPAPLVLFTSHT